MGIICYRVGELFDTFFFIVYVFVDHCLALGQGERFFFSHLWTIVYRRGVYSLSSKLFAYS
jgi:hypothetical protein